MKIFRCIVCSTEFTLEEASRLSMCPVCYSGNQLMPIEWDVHVRLNWSEITLLCDTVRRLQEIMGPHIAVDVQQAFRAIVARLASCYPAQPPVVPPMPEAEDEPPTEAVLTGLDASEPPVVN